MIRRLLALAALTVIAAALWWRKNPSACPYGQRFFVEAPHPLITRDRLRQILEPESGERVLEIGPGTGYYTLDLAEWVGPDGAVEIFDIQQEMLDHTMERARERGISNLHPTLGDARSLPYDDDSFDAVALTTVLGEIPDPDAALREINRVLKPGGAADRRRAVRGPAHGHAEHPAPPCRGREPRVRGTRGAEAGLLRAAAGVIAA